MIKVIVADDHPAPRIGIVKTISEDPSIKVVGEAGNGPELWALLARNVPDVLLLDFRMPEFDALKEVPDMRKQYPDMAILIVSAFDEEEYVRSLAQAGVFGYMLKDEEEDTYIEAVHEVAQGRLFFKNDLLHIALSNGIDTPKLTEREEQVLALIAKGNTSEQIARELKIKSRTVGFHVENIMQKLDVNSRAAAAAKASEMGLISAWKGK